VKELRERTGVGIMECKKALVEFGGDIDKAIEALRKAGLAKAVVKGSRKATEGTVAICLSNDRHRAAMVEVNSETDFAARNTQFQQFSRIIAMLALKYETQILSELSTLIICQSQKTIEETRVKLVAQLGENVAIRRVCYLKIQRGTIGDYLHVNTKLARIASLVSISRNNVDLAKDLAMQVAAMKPEYISEKHVPDTRILKEKEIFMSQARKINMGKSDDILEKIVTGKVKKFMRSITLQCQPFVKNANQTIEQLISEKKIDIIEFARFEVGEIVEK